MKHLLGNICQLPYRLHLLNNFEAFLIKRVLDNKHNKLRIHLLDHQTTQEVHIQTFLHLYIYIYIYIYVYIYTIRMFVAYFYRICTSWISNCESVNLLIILSDTFNSSLIFFGKDMQPYNKCSRGKEMHSLRNTSSCISMLK